jgi:hypothetical protein
MNVPKKITNEELARMMSKGFEDMSTKDDLRIMATKEDLTREILSVRHDLEEIKIKFDHVAHKFEVKDLEKRVSILENKIRAK